MLIEDLADIFLKTYGEGKRYKQSTRKDASIQKQQLVEIKRKPLCILSRWLQHDLLTGRS